MSQLKTITVESVEIKGPYESTSKAGKALKSYLQVLKDSSKRRIKTKAGEEIEIQDTYSKFTNNNTPIASKGDTLDVLFDVETNGKYKNNKIIEVSAPLSKESKGKVEQGLKDAAEGNLVSRDDFAKYANDDKPPFKADKVHTTYAATSKDISMEVSGLLQALINTGMYINEKSYFKDELLETHLRLALNIKRKVASELEQQK